MSKRPVSLAAVLIWFYFLLGALLNPAYTPPNIPGNPVMPFLTADIVNRIWPLILVSVPVVMLAAKQIARPSEGRNRQVSPQEFARIQARAHATKERAGREAGRQEPRVSTPTPAEVLKREEPGEQLLRPASRADGVEFTPPPTMSQANQTGKTPTTVMDDQESASEPAPEHVEEQTAESKEAKIARRIEELETERDAIASLLDRLEDMRGIGAIQPELYDKLKKKYIAEQEKINSKIEKLPLDT